MDKDATGMQCNILYILLLPLNLLLFPQCSLVLPQPVSKDAVELFDDIVIHFTILTLFLHYCQSYLIHIFLCKNYAWLLTGPSGGEYSRRFGWHNEWPDLIARPRRAPWGCYGTSTHLCGGMLCNPLWLNSVRCWHASVSWLIWIQSGFNPHPEVD